ncbi:MAG: ATP-binding cassette domain-containing protein [Verrucomicrobia bacterium]|nr:ATP-binding cassette domain-containing protein [Verrucomicrobiota bacterium]
MTLSDPAPVRSPATGVKVEVRGLHKQFGRTSVLQDINLIVDRGEIFVVMGPSGSGKSVLLKHLIGLEVPDQGEILIEDVSILASNIHERHRLAMVFQSGALLNSLTVGENVGLYLSEHRLKPPDEIERIVVEKLGLVGLEGMANRLVSELSGGMKKRVAIARALVIEPQLLLYDEPTSELDPVMSVVIGEEIYNLNQRIGVTSVVVSHDRDLAFGIADRMAIIHQGVIVCVGTPDEVRSNEDTFVKEFLNADLKLCKTKRPL